MLPAYAPAGHADEAERAGLGRDDGETDRPPRHRAVGQEVITRRFLKAREPGSECRDGDEVGGDNRVIDPGEDHLFPPDQAIRRAGIVPGWLAPTTYCCGRAAHCVSEWGNDFPPRLPAPARDRRAARTADRDGLHGDGDQGGGGGIVARFGLREPLQVRSGFDRPNLSFDVVRLEGKGSKARRTALLEAGLADPANRPAIVYCGTRRDTDEVAQTLREAACGRSPTTPAWSPRTARPRSSAS